MANESKLRILVAQPGLTVLTGGRAFRRAIREAGHELITRLPPDS